MRFRVKWVAALLCCALLLGAVPALAADTVTLSVRVEGPAANILYEKAWSVPAGTNALAALSALFDSRGVAYTASEKRFTAVANVSDGRFGGKDGWIWCLGNAVQTTALSDYTLRGGETLLLCYADVGADAPTLLPFVTAARGADGRVTLTFAAQRVTLDADWKPVYATVPVAGAAVAAGAGSYTTGADGKVLLSAADSALDRLPLQISAAAADGRPLVVRLAPDAALDLTAVAGPDFTDVADGAWYAAAVRAMAERGVAGGYGGGIFKPQGSVTRAEAALMLARLANADLTAQPRSAFADVADGTWYTGAADWAAVAAVFTGSGGRFLPNDRLTRQDLAVILVRYADRMGIKLPSAAAAPAFDDAFDVAPYAAEAVYRLQKAGVVAGSDGRYLPRAACTRAEFCVMLQRLLAAAK